MVPLLGGSFSKWKCIWGINLGLLKKGWLGKGSLESGEDRERNLGRDSPFC